MVLTKALMISGTLLVGTILSVLSLEVSPVFANPTSHSTPPVILSQTTKSTLTGTITKIQGNQVTIRSDDGEIYVIRMSQNTIDNNALVVGKKVVTVVRYEGLATEDVTVIPASRTIRQNTVETQEIITEEETTTETSNSTPTETKTIRGMW